MVQSTIYSSHDPLVPSVLVFSLYSYRDPRFSTVPSKAAPKVHAFENGTEYFASFKIAKSFFSDHVQSQPPNLLSTP